MTQPQLDVRPFEAMPRWLAQRLRPHAEGAADELLRELLLGAGPGLEPPVDGSRAGQVRSGIVAGLKHFYDLVESPRSGWDKVSAFYLRFGTQLAHNGSELLEAQQALRWSAQAVWRSLTALTDSLNLDHTMLGVVADAQFSYLDAVSAVITTGYESEAPSSVDEARQRKVRLLGMLLADPAPEREAILAAAREAKWPLPRTVATVVVRHRGAGEPRTPLMLPGGLLVDLGMPGGRGQEGRGQEGRGQEPCLLVPDPDGPGRTRLLEPMLRDWIVAIGPTVPVERAAESLRWARDALVLARRGVISDADLIRAADHVPTLVIFRAEELIDNAAGARLAPLNALSPVQRDRLTETLLALLENNFNATEASHQLHVHPQTVRYRLRHLEELFGADLQDPRRCLELEMILHVQRAGSRMPNDPVAEEPLLARAGQL